MKQGDIHPETGLVFWSKQKSCANGERWMTPEKYAQKKSAIAAYKASENYKNLQKKRRNTDAERAKRNRYAKVWGKSEARKKKSAEYARKRRSENPMACLAERLRARIREAFKKNGFSKRSTTASILGCTWPEFVLHIESLFSPGMSWSNRDKWHIDHIKPLASAITEEEMIALSHYTNLQPLWAKENQKKGASLLDAAVYCRRAIEELDKEREAIALKVEEMGMQGFGTLAIAAAIRRWQE